MAFHLPQSNFFAFHVQGDDLDVDACIDESGLTFDRVHRCGDRKGCSPVDSRYVNSGATLYLGDGRLLDPSDQQRLAAEFLESSAEAVAGLVERAGMDRVLIVVQQPVELDGQYIGFGVYPDPRLMSMALRLGVELMFMIEVEQQSLPS